MHDMTRGKPSTVLWKFSLPLVGSMFFQQLYNMVDSIIVGRYVGSNALASVGASYPVLMIFMALATGINIGTSVVISQYYGAKHYKQVKTAASTAMISITVLSLTLMGIGIYLSHWIMTSLNTPAEVFYDARSYLVISLYSLFFIFSYNISNGVFAAMGDSQTPFYFLVFSSMTNILLDLYFVKSLGMGVQGAAWATFISQGIAAVLALFTLIRRILKVAPEKVRYFSRPMLTRIGKVAVPSIFQQSFISVGNLLIQGLVNSYGPVVMAAYSAAIKLNTFAVMTLTTVANGLSNYAGQNIGAGNVPRVREGFKAGIKMALTMALPFVIIYFFFTNYAMSLFLTADDSNLAVIMEGRKFLRTVSPFYLVLAFKLIPDGVMRGAGAMRAFMVSTFSDLILRVLLSFVFSRGLGLGSFGIWLSWPLGWATGTLVSLWFYRRGKWTEVRLTDG